MVDRRDEVDVRLSGEQREERDVLWEAERRPVERVQDEVDGLEGPCAGRDCGRDGRAEPTDARLERRDGTSGGIHAGCLALGLARSRRRSGTAPALARRSRRREVLCLVLVGLGAPPTLQPHEVLERRHQVDYRRDRVVPIDDDDVALRPRAFGKAVEHGALAAESRQEEVEPLVELPQPARELELCALDPRVARVPVHLETLVACLVKPAQRGSVRREREGRVDRRREERVARFGGLGRVEHVGVSCARRDERGGLVVVPEGVFAVRLVRVACLGGEAGASLCG